jgi:hypothetical protein
VTDDEGVNGEFEELVERMADPSASQEVEICEVAEQASMVEVIIPVTVYEEPEVVLFRTIAEYLASTPRRAVVGITVSYELRSHNLPHLIATLFLSAPV